MTSFPLYDTLVSQLTEKEKISDLTVENKKKIIKIINSMGVEDHELVYVLIKIHSLSDEITSFIFPYGGTTQKTNIVFDFDKLPLELKHIIHKFVLAYEKKK